MRNGTEDQVRQSGEMTCVILRHGRTSYNESGRYLGWRDEPLTKMGEKQIRAMHIPGVEICVCSPLTRCRQTAKLLWPDADILEIDDFKEIDFGSWEGRTYQELSSDEKTASEYQAWIDSEGEKAFPDGESRAEFIKRVMKGWDFFLRELDANEELQRVSRIGFVVHGGTIMALLCSLFGGAYYDYHVGNVAGYQFRLNRYDKTVSGLTDVDIVSDTFGGKT